LQALRQENGAVLLIDEVDKANEEFEAFLLEILSAFQVTIPEIGTIKAIQPPLVFLTSNNTRDMSDALKRRCLHLHIPLPDAKLESAIVAARVPDIDARLARQLVAFVQELRTLDLKKLPSISETLDWARALVLLHGADLDRQLVRETLNVILKFEADIAVAERQLPDLMRTVERAN
jgi:MoxR-like ATPase